MAEVKIVLPEDQVALVYELLRGVAQSVTVNTVTGPRGSRYINGRRDKGIKGKDLVLQSLAKKALTRVELAKLFREHGFADTSMHSQISELKSAGLIQEGSLYLSLVAKKVVD